MPPPSGGGAIYSSQVISLCTEQGFPFWAAGGHILEGWAACLQGEAAGIEVFRAALAAWRKTGARLWLPIFLALEAEAYAKAGHGDTALQVIEEAVAISDETGEAMGHRRSVARQGSFDRCNQQCGDRRRRSLAR